MPTFRVRSTRVCRMGQLQNQHAGVTQSATWSIGQGFHKYSTSAINSIIIVQEFVIFLIFVESEA